MHLVHLFYMFDIMWKISFGYWYSVGCCSIEKKPISIYQKKIPISIFLDIFSLFIKLHNPNAYITYRHVRKDLIKGK